jgi:hypothetical protein
MQIVLPYECVKEWSRSLMKNWSRKVKGLLLVPINWDTLRTRKLKMAAWTKDKKKKSANHERKQPQKLVYISDLHENGWGNVKMCVKFICLMNILSG